METNPFAQPQLLTVTAVLPNGTLATLCHQHTRTRIQTVRDRRETETETETHSYRERDLTVLLLHVFLFIDQGRAVYSGGGCSGRG
jgi:hypothetical protein